MSSAIPAEIAPAGRDPRQIFISHAHQDADFAHRLAADLDSAGWRAWIAPESIQPGEKWVEAIGRGLDGSGVFVVALTPAAVASNWVRNETNAAIELEIRGEVHFIPLDVAVMHVRHAVERLPACAVSGPLRGWPGCAAPQIGNEGGAGETGDRETRRQADK